MTFKNKIMKPGNTFECIHSTGGESEGVSNEISNRDRPEEKLLDSLIKGIVDILDINWKDRTVFKAVLRKTMCLAGVLDRDGLFTQFLHANLDEIKRRLVTDLDIPKDTPIDYDHAPHAKFSSIVDAIKVKLNEKVTVTSTDKKP